MKINPEGGASCSTICRFSGYLATDYADRYQRRTPEEFNDDLFVGELNIEYSLDSLECGRDSTGCFTMSAVYSTEDLVTRLDDNLLVEPTVFMYRKNPFRSDKRFFPVDFTFPFLYVNEVNIQLAGATGECILPENMQVQIRGAAFFRECSLEGNYAVIKTALNLDQAEFPPDRYDELKSFFDQTTVFATDEVTITLVAGE
jgi:hypothetical protein